jgi:hypothetical protein
MARGGLDLRGNIQAEVMRIVLGVGDATVDGVRAAQPRSRRAAYTTIQTVMNRLLERGQSHTRAVSSATGPACDGGLPFPSAKALLGRR